MDEKRTGIGKINVAKRALRIEDLEDKVKFAIDQYNRAFQKYQKGVDSINDWDLVIKALTAQMEEIREYIAVAHHNMGIVYAGKEQYEKSLEQLKEALNFNPEYAVAHYNLALVYKKLGDIVRYEKHHAISKKLGHSPKSP